MDGFYIKLMSSDNYVCVQHSIDIGENPHFSLTWSKFLLFKHRIWWIRSILSGTFISIFITTSMWTKEAFLQFMTIFIARLRMSSMESALRQSLEKLSANSLYRGKLTPKPMWSLCYGDWMRLYAFTKNRASF